MNVQSAAQRSADRAASSVLLLGGLALVLLTQTVAAPADGWRWLLLGSGIGAFALGAWSVSGRPLPAALEPLPGWLGCYFQLPGWQLLLLGMAPLFALLTFVAAGPWLEARQLPAAVLAWVLAGAAVLVGGYRTSADRVSVPSVSRAEALVVAALFALALLVRAVGLERLPPTLSGDEGSVGLAAVRFLSGEHNNPFVVGWFSFPSLYYALQSIGVALFGQTAAGVRASSALIGAGTVVAVYALGRTLFNRATGFLAALYLAAFHFHIHFSRLALNNIWDGFWATLVATSLWAGWKSGRRLYFLLSGLVLGLSFYFYVSMRVFPLLLLLWCGGALLLDRRRLRQRMPDLLLLGWVALVVALPLLLFFAAHPAEFSAPLQRVTIFNGWLQEQAAARGQAGWQIVLGQMAAGAAGFVSEPLRHWYNPGEPFLLPLAAGLFLLGLVWAVVHFDLRYGLLLLPLLAVVLLGGFSLDAPASQRYVLAAPFTALLVVLPLAALGAWLRRSWPGRRTAIRLAVVGVLAVVTAVEVRYYFGEVYDSYVLGGINGEVATAMAHYLQDEQPQHVYFFGLPRMGYHSISTVPYLAPEVTGHDVIAPLTAPPAWPLDGSTRFIFLPERRAELALVEQAYPGGRVRTFASLNSEADLFTVYQPPP